jgi:hypothetical protein
MGGFCNMSVLERLQCNFWQALHAHLVKQTACNLRTAAAAGSECYAMLRCCPVLLQACDCLYGIVLVAGRVVAVERGAAAPALNAFDLLLLSNFSSSNESLRCVGRKAIRWMTKIKCRVMCVSTWPLHGFIMPHRSA